MITILTTITAGAIIYIALTFTMLHIYTTTQEDNALQIERDIDCKEILEDLK